MPYCTIEEAWAPIASQTTVRVNDISDESRVYYPNSDIYNEKGESIYPKPCAEEKRPVKANYSRTMQRLPKTSGPAHREKGYGNQVVRYGGNNKRFMSSPDEIVLGQMNDEVPITAYDRAMYERDEHPNVPEHEVEFGKGRKSSEVRGTAKYNERQKAKAPRRDEYDSESESDTDVFTRKGSERSESDIIRTLRRQNEHLKEMLQTNDRKRGFFTFWDFIIILLIGVIVIIVLDYIYKIMTTPSGDMSFLSQPLPQPIPFPQPPVYGNLMV